MRVLVTGGAGFIGSHVLDRLAAAGVPARAFDLRPCPHAGGERVETRVGDLLDPRALRDAMNGCDAVAPEIHTVGIFSMLAFTCSLCLMPDQGPERRLLLVLARSLAACVLLVLAVRWHADVGHALGYDVDLGLVITLTLAGLAVATRIRRSGAAATSRARSSG